MLAVLPPEKPSALEQIVHLKASSGRSEKGTKTLKPTIARRKQSRTRVAAKKQKSKM